MSDTAAHRPTLAVTGSTGWLGGLVARELADRGVAQRLLVRDVGRAPALPGAEPVQAAYADRAAAEAALAGVETLFMVSAAENEHRLAEHRAFVDAAAAAGVRHVVYVSFFGAAPQATFTLARDHAATEQHLKESGMAWTFLRDNLYLEFVDQMMGEDGVIRGPASEGRAAVVAHEDIAHVATNVMLDPLSHAGETYSLTGPEALTFAEMAAVVSDVTGREVTFHDETVEEAYASRAVYGAPDWQVDAWVSTYTAVAKGELDGVTDDVERLTGRPPLSLRTYLESQR
ncbi:MAG: SDR family oxidoreductase [Terrabacter sp.]|nr:SDR family oxidoreductase [Dermatophilaceae bacterium]NUO92293.1 SDR family oxidoreductase [Dermatophilaceae bacterium]NUR16153.1 SDR family oxidoreductase [Dermatophilaceae bacterium]NUR80392.1 SDR family oxidoreductase [Dermatophilaceae bacterium]NUS41361.1 SDR family oxidoreductase [Terrabacter sp.]